MCWGKFIALIDDFVTEFTTDKKAVIRSKWMRGGHLVTCMLLFLVMMGYNMVMKLDFLERVPIDFYVRIAHKETFTDFFGCDSTIGNCVMRLPDKETEEICTKPQEQRIWNSTTGQADYQEIVANCTYFDARFHLRQEIGSLMFATREVRKRMKKDAKGIWQGVPQNRMISYVIGSLDQMVKIEGSVGGKGLEGIAGFLKFQNESAPRRIRCASKSTTWSVCDIEDHDVRHQHCLSPMPAWSPTMNSSMLGCAVAIGSGILCPVTVLLQAAGVSLDEEQSDDDDKPQESVRSRGKSISLQINIANVDPDDFWRWPIGKKTKFTITPIVNEVGVLPMYSVYKKDESEREPASPFDDHETQVIDKVEMYGIHIVLTTSTNWREFRITYFGAVVVLFFAVMGYANVIVTNVLVRVYRIFGLLHVSLLYEYNAISRSVPEGRVWACTTHEHMERAHLEAMRERLDGQLETLHAPKVKQRNNIGEMPLTACMSSPLSRTPSESSSGS